MFRGVLAFVLTFVIPLVVMMTYPALALLGTLPPARAVAAVAGSVLFAFAARRVWVAALVKYTSAGDGSKAPPGLVSNASMGMHSTVQEGSVTVSLLELGRLEAERVRQEREVAEKAVLAAEAARIDEARRTARAKEEAEQKAERERREQETQAREEQARLDAVRAAAIEKARVLALQQAEAEERRRAHERDVELAAIADRSVGKRLRRVVAAQTVLVAVVIGGGALGYGVVLAPAAARRVAAAQAGAAERDQTIASLRADLSAQSDELAQARKRASVSSQQASSLAAEVTRLKSERDARGNRGKEHHAPAPAPMVKDTDFSTRCDPESRDPLCGSLAP